MDDDGKKWEECGIPYNTQHYHIKFDKDGFWEEDVEYRGGEMEVVRKLRPVRENRKVTEIKNYDWEDEYIGKTVLKYLSNNTIEWETYDENGNKESFGKDIFSNGLLTERTYTIISINESFTTKTDYDKNGIAISYKVTNGNGETISDAKFECIEFDDKGNWIKKLMFVGDKTMMIKREIEYY